MDQTNIYEGMFLFPQAAAGDLQGALDHVTELLERAKADIISLCKWDERRLAFEIKGNKRGVYFLAYFKADPTNLVGLERDCNLSEKLLRSMVVKAEHVPAETVEAAEGRAKLADEIKLRAEEALQPSATAAAVVTKAEPAAPAPATEAAPETPAEAAPAPEAETTST
ncbi:MAG: 30S ribosomal protein S6 [Planctomycetes bacterium]|nr:30S ribosomal protein S6 [Planctomycetota bacterium]